MSNNELKDPEAIEHSEGLSSITEKKLLLAANPFSEVVFSSEEATLLGAFEETALPEDEDEVIEMLDVERLTESL